MSSKAKKLTRILKRLSTSSSTAAAIRARAAYAEDKYNRQERELEAIIDDEIVDS